MTMVGFVVNGFATLFYGPAFGIRHSISLTLVALFIGGFSSSYTLIPQLGEMIDESKACVSNRPED